MVDILTSPLDLFWDIVRNAAWLIMAWAWWYMRKAQRNYKQLWRSALKITEEVHIENERVISERDEMTGINADLLDILDASEERWSALESEQQARADAARAILKRRVEQQREERDRKHAEGAARLMANRALGAHLVTSASHSRLVGEYKRRMVGR